jgi:serine/threonine protein kinase
MSDDRFKQARRSLMSDQEPSYGDSEDATAMVDINELRQGGPQFAPPPNFGAEDDYDATEMVAMPDFGSSPSGGGAGGKIQIGGAPADPEGSTQFVNINELAAGPPPGMGGGAVDGDGATQMVDIATLQAGAPVPPPGGGAGHVPDYGSSGYEGSTQFVDLNALAAGQVGAQPGGTMGQLSPVEQDPVLIQAYEFAPEAIQRFGQYTLVFARNKATGADVVLKRVWEGMPDQMPEWLRTRVNQLSQIVHPKLAALNGLFASHSGAWVELERPPGMRLTHVLQQRGTLPDKEVGKIAHQVAQAIQSVHAYQILYSTLTLDAVWVDENGDAKIEPFDVVAFEERGDLGPFGAPEMRQPPEQRPVTPATDVYSFAMVLINALQGQPDPALAGQVKNKKLSAALTAALDPNPHTRPATFEPILSAIGGGGASIEPKQIALIAVAAVAVLGVVAVLLMPGEQAAQVIEDPNAPLAEEQRATNESRDKAEPPGPVIDDPRLVVVSSFTYNPASDDGDPTTDDKPAFPIDNGKADTLVKQARKNFESASKYRAEDAKSMRREALEDLARAIRYRGGTPGPQELMLAREFAQDDKMEEVRLSIVDEVEDHLFKKDVSAVSLSYKKLNTIDAVANDVEFFVGNTKAKVTRVEPVDPNAAAAPPMDDKEEDQ